MRCAAQGRESHRACARGSMGKGGGAVPTLVLQSMPSAVAPIFAQRFNAVKVCRNGQAQGLRTAASAIHDVEMTADRPSNEADTQRHTPADLRVALVHYWLVSARGGEARALEEQHRSVCSQLCRSVRARHRPVCTLWKPLPECEARTTFIAKLPAARRLYPAYPRTCYANRPRGPGPCRATT